MLLFMRAKKCFGDMKSQNRIMSLNNLYCIRRQQTKNTIAIRSYVQHKSELHGQRKNTQYTMVNELGGERDVAC